MTLTNKKIHLAVFFGSIAVSFILYGNTIPGNFVYDDNVYVNREDLKQPESLPKVWNQPMVPNVVDAGLFHPLSTFSFNLNFVLFGESPTSFHIINIILNGLVIFLVFLLSKKLFGNVALALFIALFYAFLPIHTEAVANIKGRDEILTAFFAILSWLSFLRATEAGDKVDYRQIFLSAALFFLAVLSKALIIALPALFLAVFLFRKKPPFFELVKISAIYVFVFCIYMFWRYQVLGAYAFGGDILFFAVNPLASASLWPRVFTAFKILTLYIGKTFVPWNLSASYHFNQVPLVTNLLMSWQAVSGLVTLVLLAVLSVIKRIRATPIGIGILTFLIPYLVFSKIFFKGGDLMAERWMYFPSLGFSMIGGFLIYSIYTKRRKTGIAIFVLVPLIYSLILIPRNRVWLSEENLRRSMIESAPQSIQGHYGLAQFYLENNRLAEAKEEAEIAYRIYDRHPPLLNTIGSIAFLERDYKLAEASYLLAIEEAPFSVQGYQNAARLYFTIGKYEKAEDLLEYLLTNWSHPRVADFVDYALVLAKRGKYDESLEVINQKFAGNFSDPRVRLVLAIDYYKLGRLEEAKKYFDWSLSLSEEEKIKILSQF